LIRAAFFPHRRQKRLALTDTSLGQWHEIERPRTRVLVIEDDASVSMAIQSMLSNQGCDTVLAPDAPQGVQAFEAAKFDVVVVDIFIPGMDGLKIIKEFRHRIPTLPIVAMSGFRFRNSMAPTLDFLGMASQLGAVACLRKPFSPQQLMAAISSSLTPAFVDDHAASCREPG
jgi:CheY-like chemotaxis protein